ncbi:hypothetical protein EVJ58_g11061 [Rhodofomes roseus]|uniref:non-specific serine/threonine protein kinase n=1 Tax=Rhodofomes roseus TaxID=34475 RepID=A0A4Y9XKA6_9APHY|nr:hypothetical protein EVJ58_g11061 [Rhodofomes roseus]
MSPHISASSAASLSGFPEEDLREAGRNNSGYFAARLGQTLERGRYCIMRKLGWGQYSSVWLARDFTETRFVALKILTSKATEALSESADQQSDEQCMLKKVADADPAHRGYRHHLAYIDAFDLKGPHGLHHCLVTEVLGFGMDFLRKLRDKGDTRIAPSIVKHVVRQVLLGLEYLHEECGIVHTDLKHDNILFRPRDLHTIISHELSINPSITYDCGTELNPSVIPVVSQSLPLSIGAPIHEHDLDVVLADLGHSHWISHHFQEQIQPFALRAPEVLLGYPWSTPVDIWSLGCLINEWLTGGWLFEPTPEPMWSFEEDHLARMTEAVDAHFEPSFLANCKRRDEYFNQEGVFAHFTEHKEPTWPLRRMLETYSELGSDSEIEATERFMKRCLQLSPERRATARELVDDPWLAV